MGETLSGINPDNIHNKPTRGVEAPKVTIGQLREQAIAEKSARYVTPENLEQVELAGPLKSIVEQGGKIIIDLGGNLSIDRRVSNPAPTEKR